jgi:hypothetical protein
VREVDRGLVIVISGLMRVVAESFRAAGIVVTRWVLVRSDVDVIVKQMLAPAGVIVAVMEPVSDEQTHSPERQQCRRKPVERARQGPSA